MIILNFHLIHIILFIQKFIIEVPDNWAWGEVQNVQMNEMMSIIDNALNNGYTVAWGC